MSPRGLAWRPCAVTAGGIVTRDYAVTETGVVERASDTSLPHGEQTSYRWATFTANPSLDAWTDEWADSDGPRDVPPSDIKWSDVDEARVARLARNL